MRQYGAIRSIFQDDVGARTANPQGEICLLKALRAGDAIDEVNAFQTDSSQRISNVV